ncbi:MAG TPA: carotenoid biosynthesis protein [Thermoplasmata archaeon]|nr:carotenoid biosynthesis protein [Thermoplasmata archaeon]
MEGSAAPRSALDRAYVVGFAVVAATQVVAVVVQIATGEPVVVPTVLSTALILACMLRIHGLRGSLTFIGLVVAIPLGSEFLGVLTGIPYGRYEYVATPGPLIFGMVPAFILIAWINIAYLSIATTTVVLGRSSVWLAPVDGLIAVAWDMTVDPLAVRSGFWAWIPAGPFDGVPWSNFLGWFIVVTVLSLVVRVAWSRDLRAPRNASRVTMALLPAMLLASEIQYATLAIAAGLIPGAAIGLAAILSVVFFARGRVRAIPRERVTPSPWVQPGLGLRRRGADRVAGRP